MQLVRCYGAVTIGQPWLITEYCVNGSLDHFLRNAAEKTGLKYSMTSKVHLVKGRGRLLRVYC